MQFLIAKGMINYEVNYCTSFGLYHVPPLRPLAKLKGEMCNSCQCQNTLHLNLLEIKPHDYDKSELWIISQYCDQY